MANRFLVFLVSLLLACFIAESASAHQKVSRVRGSMRLSARSHAQLKASKAKDSGDDDADDDDDDDEEEESPTSKRQAQLEKKLADNKREQEDLKEALDRITDPSKSDKEIQASVKLVVNETDSPAMGNMLGKMWKEMRMFETPAFKKHVKGELQELKDQEHSVAKELADADKKPKEKAALKEEDPRNGGLKGCQCVGIDEIEGDTTVSLSGGRTASYPADVGARCEAWDLNDHPDCPGESWCKQQWCYVDPCKCDAPVPPKESFYLPDAKYQGKPLHFSYVTCGGADSYTEEKFKKSKEAVEKTCAAEVEAEMWGAEECRCVGIGPQPGTTKVNVKGKSVDFPADTGAFCKKWEEDNHPDCDGKNPPEWCSQAWCYVDPCSCKLPTPPKTSSYLPDANFQGKPVYYSYATCGGKDAYTSGRKEACVNQKTPLDCSKLDKCAWTGEECLGKELVSVCKMEDEPGTRGTVEPFKGSAYAPKIIVALLLSFVRAL